MTTCSIVHSETLTYAIDEALLISAYDIRHKLIADSERFKSGFAKSLYATTLVLIIDSGWYEKSGNPPGSPFVEDLEGPLSLVGKNVAADEAQDLPEFGVAGVQLPGERADRFLEINVVGSHERPAQRAVVAGIT